MRAGIAVSAAMTIRAPSTTPASCAAGMEYDVPPRLAAAIRPRPAG